MISVPEDVSIVFSFIRGYFNVSAPIPGDFMWFLQSVTPAKQKYELYLAIGFYETEKTEFVLLFNRHLIASNHYFMIAPKI